MHDDQHGTAGVAVAAMKNMFSAVSKDFTTATVAQVGLGAAGLAIALLAKAAGARTVWGVDPNMNATNYARGKGIEILALDEAVSKADLVCLTTGQAGLLSPKMCERDN